MDVKKVSEAALAFVPADTTGLLIMKIQGDWDMDGFNHMAKYMNGAIEKAGLHCTLVITCVDFTLQHLTDDALRDIGFQRIYSEFT